MKRTREELKARADRKKRAFRQKLAYNLSSKQRSAQVGNAGVKALSRPPRSVVPNFGGPFGQVFETELNYAEYFSLDPTTGGNSSYLFLANGCYDPNVTGTGHQPHGFDQLAVIYENWQVLSSAIEVVMFPQTLTTAIVSGTGSIIPQIMGSVLSLAVRDTSENLTGISGVVTDILERPNIVTKYVNSNNWPTTIRTKYSMPVFYGSTRALSDTAITGNAGSDPTDKVYYHVIFGPPDGSTNLPGHQFCARIKYKVRFFNPKNLTQS